MIFSLIYFGLLNPILFPFFIQSVENSFLTVCPNKHFNSRPLFLKDPVSNSGF